MYCLDGCPTVLDESEKPSCKLMNAIILMSFDRIARDQFRPNSESRCAGNDETCCRLLIYTTGSDQFDLWQWQLQGANIETASYRTDGKNLYKVSTHLHGGDDLSRCESSRNRNYVSLKCAFNHFGNEACAGEKTGSCVETTLCCLQIEDSSGAHHHIRVLLRQFANHFDSTGNGHGDFGYWDPGAIQGLSGVTGMVGRFRANSGKDPDFFNESADLYTCHTIFLTSLGV